ncbi:class II aldolase/adducin family protein [Streptomyces sp. NPDC007063]|uniref:class II aldolase/adducin family protein n=1 Tax=Streptomyces sp. NPDC007063 TaxID=3364772 RepID=UPI0036C1B116
MNGRAFAALGEPLEPLTRAACAFHEHHALLARRTGVGVDAGDGARIAAALDLRKPVILRIHGLLTVEDSVEAGAWRFLRSERACGIRPAAKAAGQPVPVEHRHTVTAREQLGSDLACMARLSTSLREDHPGRTRPGELTSAHVRHNPLPTHGS